MKDKNKIQMNFMLNEDVVSLIDSYAKILGLSRATMLRNLVLSGLEDAKVLKAVGVLNVAGAIRNIKKKSKPVLDLEEVI